MTDRKRVAILISGRGSNMTALIRAARDGPIIRPRSCSSCRAGRTPPGLSARPRPALPTAIVSSKDNTDRAEFEAKIDDHLNVRARRRSSASPASCACCREEFVERWRDRLINIHPSILPAFQGLNTHERAIAAGVKLHGCTVHFVRAAMDAGPIIAQAAVPVLSTDTPDDLAARVLGAEHRIYPAALALVAAERTRVVGERVVIADLPPEAALGMLTSPATI